MAEPSPIAIAPHDGTLIRLRYRSEAEPLIGYWSRAFIGWVSYTEGVPLIRHDVTGWESIADQAAVIATPVTKARRRAPKPVVVGRGGRQVSQPNAATVTDDLPNSRAAGLRGAGVPGVIEGRDWLFVPIRARP
jgi:hypothetical protein